MGSGKLIKRAVKKYGKENFKKEIIVEGNFNQNLLNELEKHYIQLFNSTNKYIGYNISKGGFNAWLEHTEETKRKISEIHLKNYGYPVFQYDLYGNLVKKWPSLSSTKIEFTKSNIGACIRGRILSSSNYIWLKDPKELDNRLKLIRKSQKCPFYILVGGKIKKCKNLNALKKYAVHLNHRDFKDNKYIWVNDVLVSKVLINIKSLPNKPNRKRRVAHNAKKVLIKDSCSVWIEFDSIKQAARYFGKDRKWLSRRMNGTKEVHIRDNIFVKYLK